jgi:hypothetical protein
MPGVWRARLASEATLGVRVTARSRCRSSNKHDSQARRAVRLPAPFLGRFRMAGCPVEPVAGDEVPLGDRGHRETATAAPARA